MQQQIAAFIMRHIHKSLYLLAVKSTATRKKRHRLFGSVSFTYTGRKKQHSSSAEEGEEKQKNHSKSHHLKREELSINQSTNMVVVCSIWSAETKNCGTDLRKTETSDKPIPGSTPVLLQLGNGARASPGSWDSRDERQKKRGSARNAGGKTKLPAAQRQALLVNDLLFYLVTVTNHFWDFGIVFVNGFFWGYIFGTLSVG